MYKYNAQLYTVVEGMGAAANWLWQQGLEPSSVGVNPYSFLCFLRITKQEHLGLYEIKMAVQHGSSFKYIKLYLDNSAAPTVGIIYHDSQDIPGTRLPLCEVKLSA